MKQVRSVTKLAVLVCLLWSSVCSTQGSQVEHLAADPSLTPHTGVFFSPASRSRPLHRLGPSERAAAGQDVFFFITQFGSQVTGPGELDNPSGLAVDGAGDVYVADTNNDRVQKFDSNGNFILQFGETGDAPGQLFSPESVAVDRMGSVWVADTLNGRVEKFDAGGGFILQIGGFGFQGLDGFEPFVGAIAIGNNDMLYVLDSSNHQVEEFSLE
ncbi:MAG: SBBP repeat-containing protein, partial [Blastocatellia bacterium]